jgi:hypothetical protein
MVTAFTLDVWIRTGLSVPCWRTNATFCLSVLTLAYQSKPDIHLEEADMFLGKVIAAVSFMTYESITLGLAYRGVKLAGITFD